MRQTTVSSNPELYQVPQAINQGLGYGYEDRRTQPLFPRKPRVSDVKQGMLGDCYFAAAIASIVSKKANYIQEMMVDHGDRVVVRFYRAGKPTYVTVTKQVPVFTRQDNEIPRYTLSGNRGYLNEPYTQGSLWVTLLEKAYAVFQNKSYRGLLSGLEKDVFKHLLNVETGNERLAIVSPDDSEEAPLPWLNQTSPTMLRGSKEELYEWVRNLDQKKKLAAEIFGNNQNKINEWISYIRKKFIVGRNLDDLKQLFLNDNLSVDVVADILQYLAAKRLYSGYAGSAIYSTGDAALFDSICNSINRGQILTAGTPNNYGSRKNENGEFESIDVKRGIHADHAYTLLDTKTTFGGIKYIKLRNPWGRDGIEYTNSTSRDYGSKGEKVPRSGDNGTFWIEFTHFLETFTSVVFTKTL